MQWEIRKYIVLLGKGKEIPIVQTDNKYALPILLEIAIILVHTVPSFVMNMHAIDE